MNGKEKRKIRQRQDSRGSQIRGAVIATHHKPPILVRPRISAVAQMTDAEVDALLNDDEEVLASFADVRRCKVCGCTDAMACPGGCAWVEADLCSACDLLPHGETQ